MSPSLDLLFQGPSLNFRPRINHLGPTDWGEPFHPLNGFHRFLFTCALPHYNIGQCSTSSMSGVIYFTGLGLIDNQTARLFPCHYQRSNSDLRRKGTNNRLPSTGFIDGRGAYRTLVSRAQIGLCVPAYGHNSQYRHARPATIWESHVISER